MSRKASTRIPIIITELAYAEAVLAATKEGMSVAEYTEAALKRAVAFTTRRYEEQRYGAACREAIAAGRIVPRRWEYFGARGPDGEDEPLPLVRRSAGVSDGLTKCPLSRHTQKASGAEPGSTARRAAGAGTRRGPTC